MHGSSGPLHSTVGRNSRDRRSARERSTWRQNHWSILARMTRSSREGQAKHAGRRISVRCSENASFDGRRLGSADVRALHGARTRSDLGFVDGSIIAKGEADFSGESTGTSEARTSYAGVRKTTPHYVERLPSQPASARETRRRLESSPQAGNRRKVSSAREGPMPDRSRGATSSRSTRGTGART